ncbi:MAG TPA: chemotaxis protein CheB [Puia sp.]|jgi:two-component system CheB/CheR fusion protein|nr:chemotaxis protein CheB [Puia sp.]
MPESKSKNDNNIPSSNPFPVVGVGASAGGLEAFKRLIKAIPEYSSMAFILVQHLEPHHESLLAEILQKITSIPVEEVTNNVHVEPNHIYIIPSNKLLTASDGRLQLSSRLPQYEKNMPIDLFFTSLAEVYQARAIGVVLSGTATDGTQGLRAIRDQGGITFAQEQGSAAFRGMPQSAIDAGVVDFILAPEEIPAQVAKLAEAFEKEGGSEADTPETGGEDAYRQLLTLLRLRKGTDFTYYKQTTIRRRIARRMTLTKIPTLPAYLAFFRETPAEQDLLYQDILIPVTGFFRDPAAYEIICGSLLPLLLKDRAADNPLRIWIAGCSTGQETYSIAICLHEYLGDRIDDLKVQIFSTDVSEKAIAAARKGVYSRSEIAGLSPQRLEKYFEKVNGSFRVNKFIRDLCVFAGHNFLKSPPFARMDLISCRNVLIYMEPFLQKRALSTFHYALRENGYLLLGRSETTAPAQDLFLPFERKEKVYIRKTVPSKFLPVSAGRPEQVTGAPENVIRKEPGRDDFQRSADNMLLSRFSPPGVVVNQQGEIVQFRGSTSIWMEPGPGKPSLNVLKMVKDGLSFELRNALHKARAEHKPQVRADIPLSPGDEQQRVTIEVHPLPNTAEPHYLILFRTSEPAVSNAGGQSTGPAGSDVDNALRLRNEQLEKESAALREDMRSIMEDQEAVIEELQSANEELLSGSEELQSLNEELETSKEEIQSTNEELTTLNQELFDRNEQLNLARLYAESIVATIREPLLILDRNMLVRTANRSFYEKFNIGEEETEGRSLYTLGAGEWDVPALHTALGTLLSREERITDIEISFPIKGLGERILLINATRIFRKDNVEQLILLAVEDVSEARSREHGQKRFAEELAKQVEERTASLKEANASLKYSNENLEQFATIASHDLQEPLRKIRTFATILNKRYSKEIKGEAGDLLQKIGQSAERMAALIYDVLNFSKILDASVFENTDLNAILQNVIRDYDLQIEQKAAVLHYDPLPVIRAVPLQMNQLFANLLSNALKFARPGAAPVVGVSFRPLSAPELKAFPHLDHSLTYGEIVVADQGIGIDPVFAERVFLIFQRLNGNEDFDGTGVGLALCKKIVANHRGEIYVDSNDGAGARFHVILPLPAS